MTEWPPFSSDQFLEALADWYFPGAKPAIVECEGQRYRTLVHGWRKRPVSGFYHFPFYLEPLGAALAAGAARKVPYLAEVVLATTRAGEPGPSGAIPAPFVRFGESESWEDMVRAAAPPIGVNSPTRVRQKMNRVRRELGQIELRMADADVDAFEQVMRWKAAQYSRASQTHRMTLSRNLDFYRELWRRGLFTFTSLRFGGRLAAGKIGLFENGRCLWRITVYDPDLASHSPGSIVEMESLRTHREAGDTESDYLMGDEAYKFTFATHIRWIGTVGREPKLDRFLRRTRQQLGRAGRRTPALYKFGKRAEALPAVVRRRLGRR